MERAAAGPSCTRTTPDRSRSGSAEEPGEREALTEILSEGERQPPLPGCRLYLVSLDETDPDGVWVTEVWESEEAHAASLQLDRVRQQIARARTLLDPEGSQRQRLDARAGIPD